MNSEAEERRKQSLARYNRNGFTFPLHSKQLLSYLGYAIELFMFIFIQFPCFTPKERIGISIPFIGTWLVYVFFFIRGTLEKHSLPYDPNGFHCKWCEIKVKAGSKHCRSCNLCRREFDHHCFFLNNCVTSANYKDFYIGILFLTINSAFSFLLSIYVIMNSEYENGFALKQAEYFFQSPYPKILIYILL